MRDLFLAGAMLAMMSGKVWADDARTYSLFTRADNGTISLNHNLTKRECEFAMHRALREAATDEEIAKAEKEKKDRLAHENLLKNAEIDWLASHKCSKVGYIYDIPGDEVGKKQSDGSCIITRIVHLHQPVMPGGTISHAECFQ